jgi:hypothetical protein
MQGLPWDENVQITGLSEYQIPVEGDGQHRAFEWECLYAMVPQRTHKAGEFGRQQQHAARIRLKGIAEGAQHGGRDGLRTDTLQGGKDQRH